ncbi:MAG TPA: hypothetical protein PLV19_11035, partial [Nitrosomonas sp.]|nr:hypothetical protein [Nitrosomonas sp.]HQX14688.1 hypothetical protein [Nitrosomonas sp.]
KHDIYGYQTNGGKNLSYTIPSNKKWRRSYLDSLRHRIIDTTLVAMRAAGVRGVWREHIRKKTKREWLGFEYWWPRAESNHRHKDFQ